MSDQPDSPPEEDPLLGRVIAGKLKLLELLGTGAMGKVYRARHAALDKIVAIKVLHAVGPADPQRAARFKAEARAASRLEHPNSVQILDFGEDGDDRLLYIAMELLEGEHLQALLRREGRLERDRLIRLMAQTLGALAAAHEKGVVHRDMKPGNIMILHRLGDEGEVEELVKVCDFGLAKILDFGAHGDEHQTSGPMTKQGAVFGTPAYMSPEQARGEILDARTDLYAVGGILYKAVTGQTPFPAETPWGVLMRHMTEEPEPPSVLAPEVDPRLEQIILKSLAKKREDRFQTAREMRAALVAILRDAGDPRADLFGRSGSQLVPLAGGSGPTVRASIAPRVSGSVQSLQPVPPAPAVPVASAPAVPARVSATSQTVPLESGAALQTLPPASETWQKAGGSKLGLLAAAIPGSIALVLIGGLVALQLGKNNAPAPPVAPPPAAVAPAAPAPSSPAPSSAPPPAPVAVAAPEPAPAAAPEVPRPKAPAHAARPMADAKAKAPAPSAAPEPVPEPAPMPAAEPAKPMAVEAAPAPQKDPPPKDPPPKAPEPKPAMRTDFAVDVSLGEVSVGGGIPKRPSAAALSRHLDAAKACLKAGIKSEGAGKVALSATIEPSGNLRGIAVKGGVPGVERCLVDAFRAARLPTPDTGEANLGFQLEYRTR